MSSLEAKIVVVGSQGVGKTSLVLRYAKNSFVPVVSTVGASFVTKRVVDDDSSTTVRLQIWDTAGQERFRSISKLYYRGANAGVLCYDITDEHSFEEMGRWLLELKENLGEDVILHIVGTKSDLVQEDPSLRKVPFERCIAYVAEHLYPSAAAGLTLATPATPLGPPGTRNGGHSPTSKRSSGFWGQDIGWDVCHEISAKDGEGVEEVFRVITRKLVEQQNKRLEAERAANEGHGARTPGYEGGMGSGEGYFDGATAPGPSGGGSFRVGRDRRSWMGFPPGVVISGEAAEETTAEATDKRKKSKCC
ncbi:MAG: hypothetical protein M1832_004161 [Thelocarpon impressellum]|nr:MAG: hypothetical protein M1832_004161 [Thelocarpon impressellum]